MNNDLSKYSEEEALRVAQLIAGFIRGSLSEKEHAELDEWVAASDENMQLFERMTDEKNIEEAMTWMDKIDTEKALEEQKKKISFKQTKKTFSAWQWAVAATLVVTAGILIYVFTNSKREQEKEVIAKNADITPGGNSATLQLGDGSVIELNGIHHDSTIRAQIIIPGKGGEIIYSDGGNDKGVAEYHTITVPRKGQYKLILSDGTKVWLNSESSIRYPNFFSKELREVYVTGEVYFEVAHAEASSNSSGGGVRRIPFIAKAGDVSVEALGTEFNISAYANEPYEGITLVKGSVLVTKGRHENILKPGQQAQFNKEKFNVTDADIEDVLAWKNGKFKFTNAPIDAIMRQIERWYDAEVVYDAEVNYHFNGTIERSIPVSKLLHYLEKTGQVHFDIEGKKIHVRK